MNIDNPLPEKLNDDKYQNWDGRDAQENSEANVEIPVVPEECKGILLDLKRLIF